MARNCPDWAMVEGPLNKLNSPVSRRGAALNERRPAGAKGNPPPPSADVKGSLTVSRIDASSDHELVVPSVELGHLFLARLPARGGDLGQLFKERLTRRARGEENQH